MVVSNTGSCIEVLNFRKKEKNILHLGVLDNELINKLDHEDKDSLNYFLYKNCRLILLVVIICNCRLTLLGYH